MLAISMFLWVRIGSAPFGRVQASSKTGIWPHAASCKDERLALSACFVLWMVAWEALPRAKFIAPMAEEAPVWGRQIKCSMQGPGALKVSCATMKEQTWFPTPWPYKPINESITRPGTHEFTMAFNNIGTYWYRIWRVSSPQLAPNELLIRDEDNLICSRGWGGPKACTWRSTHVIRACSQTVRIKTSWAVRKGIWTTVLSDTFFWCVSMWDLGGTNWREDWISTLKPFALVRAYDNIYVHACVYIYSWMHVCKDLFCMCRYKYIYICRYTFTPACMRGHMYVIRYENYGEQMYIQNKKWSHESHESHELCTHNLSLHVHKVYIHIYI
jgi:hypothetical protein